MSKNRIIEELASYLEELVAADHFSGTVLVAKDEMRLFQHAYGMAEKNFQVAGPARYEI